MGKKCSVVCCNNAYHLTVGTNVGYHRFPEDPVLRKEWVRRCGLGMNVPTSGVVCSNHFLTEDYESCFIREFLNNERLRSTLHKGAVPSRNLPANVTIDPSFKDTYKRMIEAKKDTSSKIILENVRVKPLFQHDDKVVTSSSSSVKPLFQNVAKLLPKSKAIRRKETIDDLLEKAFLAKPKIKVYYRTGKKVISQETPDDGKREKPRSKGLVCAVSTCTNYRAKTSNIAYHRFPKNPQIRKEWIRRCGRCLDWNPKVAYICSAHFRECDYSRDLKATLFNYQPKKILSRQAVPSLNLPIITSVSSIKPADFDSLANMENRETSDIITTQSNKSNKDNSECDLTKNANRENNTTGEILVCDDQFIGDDDSECGTIISDEDTSDSPEVPPQVFFNVDFKQNENISFRPDSSDFEELINTVHFVDKSMFIKTFLEDTGKIIISAPKYFGKTVVMDMLKRFASVTNTENYYSTDHLRSSINYRLFSENNLKIFQNQEFFNRHFGQYPLIFIDFKQICCSNLPDILQKLREILYYSYMPYSYLVNISTLWENYLSKETFIKYCHSEYYRNLTKAEIETGFKFLAQVLYKHYNRKILLLIDDYDMPIYKTLLKSKPTDFEGIEYIYETISELFNCNIIDRILINVNSKLGILPGYTSKFKIKAFLNDHPYFTYFGFALKEVEEILQKNKITVFDKLVELRNWYGGYKCINSDIEIFNNMSINNYLLEKKLENYWFDSCYIPNLEEILKVYEIRILFEELLDKKHVVIKVIRTIELKHIDMLKKVIHNPSNRQLITNISINLFFQLLYELGYLTSVNNNINNDKFQCFKIPNLELLNSFKKMISSLDYVNKFSISQDVIHSFHIWLKLLNINSDQNTFIKFTETVQEVFSSCTGAISDFEAHALIYSLMKQKYQRLYCYLHICDIRIFDIVIIRDDNTAIIFGLNFLKTSQDVLVQIFNYDYYKFLDIFLVKENVYNRIYIGINIDEVKSVTISYLINTDDTENASHVVDKFTL